MKIKQQQVKKKHHHLPIWAATFLREPIAANASSVKSIDDWLPEGELSCFSFVRCALLQRWTQWH